MSTTAAGSVREALDAAVAALAAAGVQTPRLDAELLLGEATGRDRAALAADPESGVEAGSARAFGDMVRRRVAREPVAYILGRKGFRRIELAVDQRALIPRPETELLVELALELRPRRVLDAGTGSGAIALAIADELPEAELVATDTSLDALALATSNRQRLGLGRAGAARARVPCRRRASTHPSISCSPTFLMSAKRSGHGSSPRSPASSPARRSSPDRPASSGSRQLLAAIALGELETRAVGLEVGAGQAGEVAGLTRRAGFERVRTLTDLAGIERVVAGER